MNKNINVVLTGNATSLRGAMMAAGHEVDQFTQKVDNAGKSGISKGKLLGAAFLTAGVAVAAGLGFAIAAAAKFDTQMRNVQSITHESDASLQATGETLVNLSTRLPQSAATLAEGLYQIASSGFKGADGLKILEASAEAASAGLTTTEVSARAITSVLNAYGRSADDAADVSDVLFQTVNVGVVSFEELAGTIGDVVGTAAAATVEIDEVGSAIATMTLSGISGAEAGTSLNRVIQSLIDPSDDLKEALQEVGYESGASALQHDHLSVVMEKLREASNGNIETLLKWFPEIRAARGALALMSNEGRNYAAVVAQIEDKEARAHATRKALNEQLKAASAQWQLFVNWVNAAAITLGTKLLPTVINVMHGVQDLANAGIAVLLDVIKRLHPFLEAMVGTWNHLVDIGAELLDVFGPVAAAFAALGGALAITALNAFAEALESVTGFLADHPLLIQAVAIALTALLVPAMASAAGGMRMLFLDGVRLRAMYGAEALGSLFTNLAGRLKLFGQGVGALTSQFSTGTSAIESFKGAFAGLGATLAVGLAIVAVTKAVQEWGHQMRDAKKDADEWVEGFTAGFDPARVSMSQLEAQIDKNSTAAGKFQDAADNALNPFLDERLKKARDGLNEANEPLIKLRDTAKLLQDELGITSAEALNLARDEEVMAAATDPATGELDAQAAAAIADQEALQELSNQLKAMYDPLFALQDATANLAGKQMEAVAAAKEHGASSLEAKAANQEAARAAVDYYAAVVDLKAGISAGNVDIEQSIQTMYAWADQGKVSRQQAQEFERDVRGMNQEIDKVPDDAYTTMHVQTEDGLRKIAAFQAYMRAIPRTVTVTVNGVVGSRPNFEYRQGTHGDRWGGIHTYALGGVTPAHVTRNELIKYGEPETGGEAFVPRRGDPRRSTAVLAEAASWYGYALTKMAAGGIVNYASGSATRGGTTIVDLRGAQIIGVPDLEKTIDRAVTKANEKSAVSLRKKANY